MVSLITLLLRIPCVLIVTTLHEFIRAVVSTSLGDKKPKEEGRLTLNPFKHFEPIGFILLFATGGFGWGKPVETSSLFYKNKKMGTLMTAILPTVGNIVLAYICIFIIKNFLNAFSYASIFFQLLASYNIGLAVYNLFPVSPMDCVKVLSVILPANTYFNYLQYEKMIQIIFLLILFMGFTSFIVSPLSNLIFNVLSILAF